MKIAVIGSHGTRKSTFSYQLAGHYKELGKNVKLIQEVARQSPLGINDKFNIKSMYWIIMTQIAKELEAEKDHDIVICDRSVLDPLMYARASFNCMVFNLQDFIDDWMQTYDKIYFVYPDMQEIVADGVRDTNLEFRDKVHYEFQRYMQTMHLPNVKKILTSQILKQNNLEHLI